MENKIKRSIKSNQIGMGELNIILNSSGTPSVDGLDAKSVSSLVDNGVGDITIIFKTPSIQPLVLASSITIGSTPLVCTQEATDINQITVNIFDMAGVAADGTVHLCIKGCNSRLLY